jgi:hypothetical protein
MHFYRIHDTTLEELLAVGTKTFRTQCLGVKLSHPLHGGYKYGNLALHAGKPQI